MPEPAAGQSLPQRLFEGVLANLITSAILFLVGHIFGSWSWSAWMAYFHLTGLWSWVVFLVCLEALVAGAWAAIDEGYRNENPGDWLLLLPGWALQLALIYTVLAAGFGWATGPIATVIDAFYSSTP